MAPWTATLAVSAVATAAVTAYAHRKAFQSSRCKEDSKLLRFQGVFMTVYFTSLMADWLQGPYVYELYASYGFSRQDIAILFIGGFGSSMLFGTFVGALADKFGRKLHCQLYCILYMASCATKHCKDFWVLLLGRVTGGIATSLLFSAFEAWMVCEHNSRGFEAEKLRDTFSKTYFGNFLVAVVAGLAAQSAVDALPLTPVAEGSLWYYGAACSAFDLSGMFCAMSLALATSLWGENYGGQDSESPSAGKAPKGNQLQRVMEVLIQDPSVMLCGGVVSLFEGSMYVFIFNWTPALGDPSTLPCGLIFTIFMVSCMGGSSLYSILVERFSPENILAGVLAASTVLLALPAMFSNTAVVMGSFAAFEVCVGTWYPAMGTVKGRVVPEDVRATIYNCFRVPLNIIVLVVLLTNFSLTASFALCAGMLAVATLCQILLLRRIPAEDKEATDALVSQGEVE